MTDERHGERQATETKYSGKIFNVLVDRVRLPNGHVGNIEVVRHPGSVILLPMPDPDHVILVKQYRYAVDRWLWELPAGSLKPGEDPVAGAIRECEEETGLVPARAEPLGIFFPTPGYCDEAMNFFRCTELAEPPADRPAAHQDEDEDLRVQTFSLEQAWRLIGTGEMTDLKTVAGLALVRAR